MCLTMLDSKVLALISHTETSKDGSAVLTFTGEYNYMASIGKAVSSLCNATFLVTNQPICCNGTILLLHTIQGSI